VHRIGRTARAGKGGRAVTFVNDKDMLFFRQIERFLGKEIYKEKMPEEFGETPVYTRGKGHGARGKKSHYYKKKRKNGTKPNR
jgi:superfamily II DNA/RNA helicase